VTLARTRARTLVLAAIIAIGAAIATGALAYWTSVGSGSATTMLASPIQLTLEPGTADAQLSPGHAAGVAVIAANPNDYFVPIGSLTLDNGAGTGGFDVDAGHATCDLSVLHLAPQDNGGAGWRVPPRIASTDGTRLIVLGHALSMDADAADACQGASFTVHLRAGA